jgi:peptide chain release factor 1
VKGKGVKKFFSNESGGHRFQRVPPTERNGRVHTSIITVSVLEESNYEDVEIYPSEVRVEYTRGTGKGGQHKNKTDSCVILTHYATGIKVRRDGRDQHKNKRDAWTELTKRVNLVYRNGQEKEISQDIKNQIGSGYRGDKRRTYDYRTGIVRDHITNKNMSLKQFLRGKIEILKK